MSSHDTFVKKLFSFTHRHLPGVFIGAYFLSIQFVRSIDLSFLILLLGLCILITMQPIVNYRLLRSWSSAVAASLLLSTLVSSVVMGQGFVSHAMAVAQIPGLLIFLIVILFIREKSQLSTIAWSFLVSLSVCLWRFFSISREQGFIRDRELIFAASHPLYLAPNDVLMFVIFFPLIIWYANYLRGAYGIVLGAIYLVFLAGLSELLLSRITLLAIAIALFAPVVILKKGKLFYGVITLFIILAAALFYFDDTLLFKLKAHDLSRFKLWIIAWHMFLDAPWFGHGPGSFTTLYTQYLDQLGSSVNYGDDVRHMGWAHNLFLESASEKGVLGLGAIFGYFVYIFTVLIKKLKSDDDNLYRALMLSAILLLLAASAELSLLRIWAIYIMYLLLGLSAALTRSA